MSKEDLIVTPNLVKYAETPGQEAMLQNLEICIELTSDFLKTNKKNDFEKAVNALNLTLAMITRVTRTEGLDSSKNISSNNETMLLDVVHDALLLPTFILQYTANKNKTKKKIG